MNVLLAAVLAPGARAAPLDPAAFTALAPTFVAEGEVRIDTTGPSPTISIAGVPTWTGVMADVGGREAAVFVFGTVEVPGEVTVVGDAPLALLATGDLTLSGTLEASAFAEEPGSGGYGGGNCGDGSGAGAGRGGSNGGGGGGFGGPGGAADWGEPGGPRNGDLLDGLDGGSGGGGGEAHPCPNPVGGAGGGAVELGAGGRLTVAGVIAVEGGAGGDHGLATVGDGGGGGAGGGVLLHGNGGSCTGQLFARGGDGGDGDGANSPDGGGGGGGHLVAVGIDVTACAVEVGGGAAGCTGLCNALDGGPGDLVVVDPDQDGDTFTIVAGDDCDDTDASVNPGATEIPCDALDNDCDEATSDGPDNDGDGIAACAGDCDDDDASVYPGAAETPQDGVDSDCDGSDGVATGTGSGDPFGTPFDDTTLGGASDAEGLAVRSACGCAGPRGPGWLALVVVAALRRPGRSALRGRPVRTSRAASTDRCP